MLQYFLFSFTSCFYIALNSISDSFRDDLVTFHMCVSVHALPSFFASLLCSTCAFVLLVLASACSLRIFLPVGVMPGSDPAFDCEFAHIHNPEMILLKQSCLWVQCFWHTCESCIHMIVELVKQF